jgi:anti-sigma-K factor RskA
MLGNHFRAESGKEATGDERLSALLQQWKSVEPQADFEAAVWRRIRADRAADRDRRRFGETWREWLDPLPAWVNVAAVAAGIVVGVGMAFSAQPSHVGRQTNDPLLHSQTLAGSYLAMATGRNQ